MLGSLALPTAYSCKVLQLMSRHTSLRHKYPTPDPNGAGCRLIRCEPCYYDHDSTAEYSPVDDRWPHIPGLLFVAPPALSYRDPPPLEAYEQFGLLRDRSSTPFLSIPPELRLVIYSMTGINDQPSRGIEVRPTLAFRTRKCSIALTLSNLSRTCKRIHSEVMGFYHTNLRTTIRVGLFPGHKRDCFPRQMSNAFTMHFARLRSVRLHVQIPLMTRGQMKNMLLWFEHLLAVLRLSDKLESFEFEVEISGQRYTCKHRSNDVRSLKWQALDDFRMTLPIMNRSAPRA